MHLGIGKKAHIYMQQGDKKKNFKRNLIAIELCLFVLWIIGKTSDKSNQKTDTDDNKISQLVDEVPQLPVKNVELGKIKQGADGESVGKKTELTELKQFLSEDEYGSIEIVWVWDCSPKYGDMPMKLTYDKTTNVLKEIYTQNNVIEEYKNIRVECLKEFLEKGEKGFHRLEKYCDGYAYDFNDREMAVKAVGPKPEQSEVTGSVKIVEKYIKDHANDASSIKFVEWSKVAAVGENWLVRCKFKGTNQLGGVVTTNMLFFIQNNQVVRTSEIK